MLGLLTVSQMAAASLASFFAPCFGYGLTSCGAMSRMMCPNVLSTRLEM